MHLAGVQARGTESRSSCQCEAGSTQKVSGGAFSAEAEGSNPSGGSPHHRRRIEHDGRLAQKRKASPPRCDKALSAPRYEQPCRTPAQEASCSAQPSSLDRRPMSAQFPACRADAAAAGRAHARQPRPVRHGGSLGSNACVAAGRSRPFSRKRLPRAHKKRRARRERAEEQCCCTSCAFLRGEEGGSLAHLPSAGVLLEARGHPQRGPLMSAHNGATPHWRTSHCCSPPLGDGELRAGAAAFRRRRCYAAAGHKRKLSAAAPSTTAAAGPRRFGAAVGWRCGRARGGGRRRARRKARLGAVASRRLRRKGPPGVRCCSRESSEMMHCRKTRPTSKRQKLRALSRKFWSRGTKW